jgi:hypothetical protein
MEWYIQIHTAEAKIDGKKAQLAITQVYSIFTNTYSNEIRNDNYNA